MADTLQRAIVAIKAGDKTTGQQLLADILRADPRNAEAWKWMAQVQDDPAKRIQCLERVLDLLPYDASAAKSLGLAPVNAGNGLGYHIFGILAILLGLGAWAYVTQATEGVAILAAACLCGILARLAQADHHQKNLLNMLARVRRR